ncbi:nitroreductase [bacterium (Candidatus Blackallbacteria) CG17_big_fil_post_rev_8_21_14_2_50_48_46]|uniref:Nitroreductase n=1 Tax=bacterium (Candidatus Blackallbacteria) CG17_big_fil_post_rev_8_21_14_2_50_48_46 TaxID=2014261 RepID=A0A2M7GBH2_9BACT|nr:MAG: nitroreductase [bacterium (Candidatus Blackallbacteria) CG18_big_fil_WC_8_21_14_2_50_49_26]PIW19534.1 MAG: nitroreductase [bacterium (Candidatus Blackallbacteria) CG17_big_fil_post_rev_8_21_14_2_50_48_46]PIW48863.1 MAG: nitroreductase [bacterium (Candidatus Blackallbacteria) CG13_big_fil_rev_8_21_14_2_50_49_14]
MHKPAATEAELIDPIRERWSPRAFDPSQEIPAPLLAEVFEAARWAPSCFNEQPWRYLIFGKNDALRAEVEACLNPTNGWAAQASHLIVICALKTFSHNQKPNRHAAYDSGAASMALILQAQSRGLASHQMAGFKREELEKALQIPAESVECLAIMALGYACEAEEKSGLSPEQLEKEKAPRQRKALEQIALQGKTWAFGS